MILNSILGAWSYDTSAANISQDVIVSAVFIALPILLYFFSKRIFPVIVSGVFSVCGIVFSFLDFTNLFVIVVVLYATLLIIDIFVNLSVFRPYLIKQFHGKKKTNRKLKKDGQRKEKMHNKTIKYLNWSGYPINAVGDPVSCEVRRTIEGGGKVTGPIKPGATYGYGTYWDCLWYNYSAVCGLSAR